MAQFKTFYADGMNVMMKNGKVVMTILNRTEQDGIYDAKAAMVDGAVVQVHEDEISHPVDQRITHHFKVGETYFQALWDERPNTWTLRLVDYEDGSGIIALHLADLATAKEEAARYLVR